MLVNALLTENLLRREMQVIIAGLAARHWDDLPSYTLKMNCGALGYDLEAEYNGSQATARFAAADLRLTLGDFADRHLTPLALQLVPHHTALINRLDAMWFSTIRPSLIEFAKQYREES